MSDDDLTAPDRILKVDEKWSVEYDPANNDRPIRWWRHSEPHSEFDGNNAVTAMFYALLEARATLAAVSETHKIKGENPNGQ